VQFIRVLIKLKATEPVSLPLFKGGILPSAYGIAFRKVSCLFHNRQCEVCLLRRSCVWSYVFDTPRPPAAGILPQVDTVPHPFVIEPPDTETTVLKKGDSLVFQLILFWRATQFLACFIYAFEQLAEQGLGRPRKPFHLTGIYQHNRLIYDYKKMALVRQPTAMQLNLLASDGEATNHVRITFLTPTRLTVQGKLCRRAGFDIVIRGLLRRFWLLSYFHDQPVEIDYRSLINAAQQIELKEAVFAGADWGHFSRRQNRMVESNGITGWAVYKCELGQFLPILRAGEILHIGKNTSFGMGKYQLEVQ